MPKRSLQRATGPQVVAAGLAVIAVTYGLARYGYGLYLPEFRTAFGLSAGTAGAVAAGGYAGYCAAALLAGRLVGGGHARATLWLAGGSAALGCLLVAVAWSAPVLAGGALVAGSGAGAATPALVAAVAATVPPAAETRAQGVVNSGTGAGVVAGGLLVLTLPGSWRWSWVGFAVVGVLVTWWADRTARWGSAAPASRGSTGARPLRRLGRPLVAAVLAGAGCAGVWTFGRDLMADQGGLPDRVTGLLWCVLGAAGLLGGGSGVLVARAGLRAAWTCSVAVAGAGTALLAAGPDSTVLAAVALACFGAAFVALSGVLLAWGADRDPAAAPAAAGVLFIGLTVGQALGAVLLGAVAGGGSAAAAFYAAAGLLVLSAGAAEPGTGSRRRRPPSTPSGASGRCPEAAERMV
ncbi:Predicted arabinose efflux permease, MFS family [Blastococcus aurantiacus]|uniref:Predicted arabinose efflux permease, MFS family n=1 Tax=Blastococcus aurantiacus TaxID=1550231 RepID=A0A1G7HIG8_9ACTN|nr:MFS transporter [Blastococcus aurantiacus]SDF00297.1 Predicted arabinose efflux permease, MFS family [Blastococcus aurantiacus]